MPLRITCPLCSSLCSVGEEARGKTVTCPHCKQVILVPAPPPPPTVSDRGYIMDRGGRAQPVVKAPPPRRRPDEDGSPRAGGRARRGPALSPVLLLVGGGAAVVALVAVLVGVLVLGRRGATEQPAPGPAAQAGGQQAPQPVGNGGAVQPAADVLAKAPPADEGPALPGEEIYQRTLKSTVWILAVHGGGQVAGGNMPLPPVPGPGPGLPGIPGAAGALAGSQWAGGETLAGYGILRFDFQPGGRVTMTDRDGNTPGTYVENGQDVTLVFYNGEVTYSGRVNGVSMSGTARNTRTTWTWNVSRQGGARPFQAPFPRPPFMPRPPIFPRPPRIGGFPRIPQPPNIPNPGAQGGPGDRVNLTTGTGSLIDRKNRLVITNCHVVGRFDMVLVYFPQYENGQLVVKRDDYKRRPSITGRVVFREQRIDLALVQLDRLPDEARVLPVSNRSARPAQQVHSVGNPGASGGLWVYSPGKVRQVFKDRWKVFDDLENKEYVYDGMKIETDSPINPGDSGGPLVNDHGYLVGVAHGSHVGAQNMSIFIDVSEVRSVMERYYQGRGEHWQPGS